MTGEDQATVASWRRRAVELDAQAAAIRRDEGDTVHAGELEQIAIDYRVAADELDLGLALGGSDASAA
jgi:hypothetical protein